MVIGTQRSVVQRFPLEEVIAPAAVAGLLVTAGVFLLSIAGSPPPRFSSQLFSNTVLNRGVTALIGAIGTIGLIAAILALFTAGVNEAILLGGTVLTYVSALLANLLNWLYAGAGTFEISLLVTPLSTVVIFLGIAVGARWVERGSLG